MNGVIRFINEVKSELSKVVWPKFDEFIESTIVVLILMTVFAVYMGMVDLGFFHLVQYTFKMYG